jgi:integrase
MTRPSVRREKVERGITRITRTYPDGRQQVSFQIRYGDGSGKMLSDTFTTAAKARVALAKARTQVIDGSHIDPSSADTKFQAMADEWLASHPEWKERTRTGNAWTVKVKLQPLHDKRMKQLNKAAVLRFRTELLTTPKADGDLPSPNSVRRTMAVLSAVCEHARLVGTIASNPCRDLPRLKVRKREVTMPSVTQVEALIDRLRHPHQSDPKVWKDPRWALLVETAAYTGLRAGELAGLKVGDFDQVQGSVTVRHTIINISGHLREDTPKSEASRRVVDDLDPDLVRGLAERCSALAQVDYVFGDHTPDGNPKPLRHMNFYRRVFKPVCSELNITMRFHDLRHFNASFLIEDGRSAVEVATRLGHDSPTTTLNIYAHLFPKDSHGLGQRTAERRAAARLEPDDDRKM